MRHSRYTNFDLLKERPLAELAAFDAEMTRREQWTVETGQPMPFRRGAYEITGGTVLQAFDSDDGTRTVLDLEVGVAAKSSVPVRATPK